MSEAPDEKMLKQLRALEVKMGLVLTLVRSALHLYFEWCPTRSHPMQQFKASVWAVINEQPIADMSGTYADTTADETMRQ